MTTGGPILVVDTATTHAIIALGTAAGEPVERRGWIAGYRHGEELLARLEGLLRDRGVTLADLGGLVVGTGPGAFTGLRVGIATVKGLAHALSLPIVGVSTGAALIDAAASAHGLDAAAVVLLQPTGPSDRVVSRLGEPPRILAGGTDPELRDGDTLVAVDLDGRAPVGALALGESAREGLADTLLVMGARRLAAGDTDDLAHLVPQYVTLPRGVRSAPAGGGVELSGGTARS